MPPKARRRTAPRKSLQRSKLAPEAAVRAMLRRARAIPALRKREGEVRGRARGTGRAASGAPGWRVDISLVSAAAMARLNGRTRGKHYATDILSFEAPEAIRAGGWLGELVICLPVLERQAREQGHPPATELRVLVAHGILHLLGFDHEGRSASARARAREMARWEARLLGKKRGLIRRVE